jgi:hypothetical protein
MSEFTRCSRGNITPAWTCVLPAGHDADHIYSLWSEIAAMAEAEINGLQAQVQAVRDVCDKWQEQATRFPVRDDWRLYAAQFILRALDGPDE